MPDRPNVLIIAIDTLRHDHLRCYGYERSTSPNVDDWLAANGVSMDNHFTQASYTHPAFTSIFTGLYPLRHTVIYQPTRVPVATDVTMLAQVFHKAGYFTAALDNLALSDPGVHFGWGYEVKANPKDAPAVPGEIGGKSNGMFRLQPQALQLIEQAARRQPFFLFLHPWDPHRACTPREAFKNKFVTGREPNQENFSLVDKNSHPEEPAGMEYTIAQYDAAIADCDDALAAVFDRIEALGVAPNTIVALTSDHGESLGEHRIYCRHAGIFDATMHVPFIIRWTEGLPRSQRRDAYSMHVDIAPTLLSLAGVENRRDVDGLDLTAILRGESFESREAVFGHTINPDMRRAIRTKDYKLMKWVEGAHRETQWPKIELYDLNADPGETVNIADKEPRIRARMEARLDAWVAEALSAAGHPDPMVAQSQPTEHARWPVW